MDDDWCVLPRTRILRLFFLLPCSSLIIIQITITILSSHVNLSFHSRSSHNPPQDQSITTSPHPSPCHWPYIYSPCNIHQFFFLGGLSFEGLMRVVRWGLRIICQPKRIINPDQLFYITFLFDRSSSELPLSTRYLLLLHFPSVPLLTRSMAIIPRCNMSHFAHHWH